MLNRSNECKFHLVQILPQTSSKNKFPNSAIQGTQAARGKVTSVPFPTASCPARTWPTVSFLISLCLSWMMGFPNGSAIKNPPAMQEMQETQVQSLGGKDPFGGGNGNPLQYSSRGQRSLAGYSPWGTSVWNDWASQRQKRHPDPCGNTQANVWAWHSDKQKQRLGWEDEREVPSLSRSTQTVSSMRVRTEREGGPWHPAQCPRWAGRWKPGLEKGASHLFGEASPWALEQRPPQQEEGKASCPYKHTPRGCLPLYIPICVISLVLVFSVSS